MSSDAHSRAQVRKIVTVVFIDVTGSTSLGERLDPERMRRLLRSYFAALKEILERHGGSVEKFIGDAVMAVFGMPIVHEDDALRACRAALEIRDKLRELNAQLELEQGFGIEVRTGLNTGEVVADATDEMDAMIVGDAVNVAARLEQSAAPGEILLGASTYRLVRDQVQVEEVEPLTVKGKAEPVVAHRLVDLTPDADAQPRRLVAPLIGRDRELTVISHAFERATDQRSLQLLTVLGAAGVGKSRLIAEFLAGLDVEHQTLRGRCLPYGEGVTYLPLAAAIKSAAAISGDETPKEASDKLASLVAGDPEGDVICSLVLQILGLAAPSAPQEELFWAARRLFEVLAAERPLLVVLDDIHWADATLLDLIEHLADWSRDAPILTVASARPELLEERPTWGGGKLNATSMLLEPLGTAASEELVDNLVGAEVLPARTRAAITAAAEGNPLFVEEMLGVLVDDGVLRRVNGRWEAGTEIQSVHVPPTINALLTARLDRLERGERAVAQVASVVGRVFDRDSVEALMPGQNGDAPVQSTIMALVRKDLVRPDRAVLHRSEGFRFRHVLIRDAAYEGLPKEERSRLHVALADWLERISGERKGEYLEIIGYHLEQAYRYRQDLGQIDPDDVWIASRAAELLAMAAGQAIARTDVPATVSLLTRATALQASDDPRRIRLLPELARAIAEVDADRGRATFIEAIERAEALGDEVLRAHAMLMARWSGLLDADQSGEERMAADERESERAIRAFSAVGDELGLARAWRLRSGINSTLGRLAEVQAGVETALTHARAAGDAREQAECIFELSFAVVQGPMPVEEAIQSCSETIEAYPANRPVEGWMVHALAHLKARLGQFDEALALAARCRQILLETGQQLSHALLSEVEGDVHTLAGNVEAAMEVMQAGYRTAEALGFPHRLLAAFTARAMCAAGHYGEAEPLATFGAASSGWVQAVANAQLAKVRAQAGDHDEARRLVHEAAGWFEPTDMLVLHGDTQMDVAVVERNLGQLSSARDAAERALGLYRQKGDVVSARRAEDLSRRLV
jgi:class 3 adenylate cyclase/tetratricopeptide (TPR) repeat protein